MTTCVVFMCQLTLLTEKQIIAGNGAWECACKWRVKGNVLSRDTEFLIFIRNSTVFNSCEFHATYNRYFLARIIMIAVSPTMARTHKAEAT